MHPILKLVPYLPLLLVACSGGSSSANRTVEPGSVLVVVDTRAGDDAIVQFQLAAATLEDAAGRQTGNLLGEPRMLTLGDASGESSGFRLGRAPSGVYEALHLILVPGSGVALDVDGVTRPVNAPLDLRVPIAEGLQHDQLRASWIVIGHDAAALSEQNGVLTWTPSMSGRVDGEALRLDELTQPLGNQDGIMTTARSVDDGLLQLAWSSACTFEDEDGNAYPDRAAFLADLAPSDELRCDGALDRDARFRSDRIRRGRHNDRPRLIGRILSLDEPSERFKLRVDATTHRGNCVFLEVPEEVIVLVADARIETSSGRTLTFADLAVGQLAKVTWLLRTPVPNALPEITASRVEIVSGGAAEVRPQIQGRVQSVDVAGGTLVVVPRHNQTIHLQGNAVNEVLVRVVAGTTIQRKPEHGGPWQVIRIEDIRPGEDRTWVRGRVIGPAEMEADRLRVRVD